MERAREELVLDIAPTSSTGALRVRELTPRGRGGVTVLELEGSRALETLASLAPCLLRKSRESLRNAVLVRLRESGANGEEDLDEALVWQRGDGAIELHMHGSPVLVRRVRELLAPTPNGALVAAHLSIEQRAGRALACASSDAAARLLLDQEQGALRTALEGLARCPLSERSRQLAQLVEAGRIASCLVNVPRVVLAGPVNAGKSTLFNLLVGRERVVVSGEEGTTRDAVRERVRLGAYAVDLVDTAGEREAVGRAADVEREGQAQGRGEAAAADVVFWLGAHAEALPDRSRVVPLATKSDLHARADSTALSISTHEDPMGARKAIESAFRAALKLPENPWRAGAPAPFDEFSRQGVADLLACGEERGFQDLLSGLLRR